MAPIRIYGMMACALALTACDRDNKAASLAALDAQLTNNATDPAVRGALNDPIVVDPQLVGQSNRNAVRTADRPTSGGVPKLAGDAKADMEEAAKLAGGLLMTAPTVSDDGDGESGMTLGAVAQRQAADHGGNANCAKAMGYAMQWADRMPEAFPVYPGARMTDAAGADRNGCTLRAASFVTPVPADKVMDYYYTLARRAGYDGEHRVIGGDHVLGGTRKADGRAYFIVFKDAPDAGTSVSIVADGGR